LLANGRRWSKGEHQRGEMKVEKRAKTKPVHRTAMAHCIAKCSTTRLNQILSALSMGCLENKRVSRAVQVRVEPDSPAADADEKLVPAPGRFGAAGTAESKLLAVNVTKFVVFMVQLWFVARRQVNQSTRY